jgi:hypothetical protein
VCTGPRASCDSDADGIADDIDSDGDGLLDGSKDLYEYLGGEATIGEDSLVCPRCAGSKRWPVRRRGVDATTGGGVVLG